MAGESAAPRLRRNVVNFVVGGKYTAPIIVQIKMVAVARLDADIVFSNTPEVKTDQFIFDLRGCWSVCVEPTGSQRCDIIGLGRPEFVSPPEIVEYPSRVIGAVFLR